MQRQQVAVEFMAVKNDLARLFFAERTQGKPKQRLHSKADQKQPVGRAAPIDLHLPSTPHSFSPKTGQAKPLANSRLPCCQAGLPSTRICRMQRLSSS